MFFFSRVKEPSIPTGGTCEWRAAIRFFQILWWSLQGSWGWLGYECRFTTYTSTWMYSTQVHNYVTISTITISIVLNPGCNFFTPLPSQRFWRAVHCRPSRTSRTGWKPKISPWQFHGDEVPCSLLNVPKFVASSSMPNLVSWSILFAAFKPYLVALWWSRQTFRFVETASLVSLSYPIWIYPLVN